LIWPGIHNSESLSVLEATLETTKFVYHFEAFKPVFDSKLLLKVIAMLTFMLLELLLFGT